MVLTDSSKLRRKVRKAYDKAMTEVEKVTIALAKFENEDRPAFERWIRLTFGPKLEELRKIQSELTALQHILTKVSTLAQNRRISMAQAYQIHLDWQNNPQGADPFEEAPHKDAKVHGSPRDETWDEDSEGADPGAPPSLEEMLNEFVERLRPPSAKDRTRIKEIYRALVRHLHPDSGAEDSEANRRLWHQCQSAYQDEDLARLELILEQVKESAGEPLLETPMSEFLRRTAELKFKLRQFKRELASCRQDPAWGCSVTLPSAAIHRRFESDIDWELAQCRTNLEDFKRRFNGWTTPRRSAPKKRRRASSDELEFPF